MDCQQCLDVLDDLLVSSPSDVILAELDEHVASCSNCAEEHRLAGEALSLLDLPKPMVAAPALRELVLAEASALDAISADVTVSSKQGSWATVPWNRPWVTAGLAASLLVAGLLLFRSDDQRAVDRSAFSLISRAYAVEEAVFSTDQIVHIVSEIVVKPIADPLLSRLRWFPLVSLEATGKTRIHQLKLSAAAGEDYTIVDETWFDPATGHFVRQMVSEGKPIYANSFDGRAVYWLDAASARIVKQDIGEAFMPPDNPAKLLGIAAGLPSQIDEKNKHLVTDAGEASLEDGSKARAVKLGMPGPDPNQPQTAHMLVTIREDDNEIAEIAFVVNEQSLFELRRTKIESIEMSDIDWNCAAVGKLAAQAPIAPQASILPDMVKQNVSVEHMIEKASFPTYVFQKSPQWAGERRIADVLDVVSPPNRMFAITHQAEDGRHVVLIQAPSYNNMLGPMVTKMGKVVYTSPTGVEVISGPRDKWLAGILLQSAQSELRALPADNRTGYLLKTPDGTLPALAINGQLSEEELHSLVDSLVPTKDAE